MYMTNEKKPSRSDIITEKKPLKEAYNPDGIIQARDGKSTTNNNKTEE